MLQALLYDATVAAFFCHELDAMQRHEWRVLPLTSFLPDRIGQQVFLWAHIPLFLAVLWFSGSEPVNGFRVGLAVFAVVHAGLHWLFRRHPAYEMNNATSWALVLLTAALGLVYLASAY